MNIKDILELKNIKEQRKHLFDTYINRMFERSTRSEKKDFSKEETRHYLSWLAYQMVKHNLITYQIEAMQPSWLDDDKKQRLYKWSGRLLFWLLGGLSEEIKMVDKLSWSWKKAWSGLISGLSRGGLFGLIVGLVGLIMGGLSYGLIVGLFFGLLFGLGYGLIGGLFDGLSYEQVVETNYPGQRLRQTLYSAIYVGLLFGLIFGLIFGPIVGLSDGRLIVGLIFVLGSSGLFFGSSALIKHYILRLLLTKYQLLPRRLIPFLEHAGDLIFLRRVGGSYIFVHRLLMEHFAEMYVEKENK